MKKLTLSLICLLSASLVWAQTTITSSHMPKANDTIRYSIAPATDLPDLTKTGTNYDWDYRTLGMTSQDIYHYKSSAQTPYILNFGFSAIGLKIADSLGTGQLALQNVYNFFGNSSSKFETVGIGFQYSSFPLPQSGKYSNKDVIYEFPLKYNNTYSGDFEAKIPIVITLVPVGNFFIKGTRTTTVDGWGKISTPYKSGVECIRLKSVINEVDSIVISTFNIDFAIPQKRIEYKWISTSERIPMLEIVGTEVGGQFIPTYIRYRDKYRVAKGPLEVEADFVADSLKPNTNDIVKFTDLSTGVILSRDWSISPNTFSFKNGTDENSTNPEVNFTTEGKYTITLIAGNLISSDTMTKVDYIEVSKAASVKDLTLNEVSISPNPFKEQLEISFTTQQEQVGVLLVDLQGKVVHNQKFNEVSTCKLTDLNIEAGIYIIKISTPSGNYQKRLIHIQ